MRKAYLSVLAIWVLSMVFYGCGGGSPYQKEAKKGLEKIRLMLSQLKRSNSPSDASVQVTNLSKSIKKLISRLEKIDKDKASLKKLKVVYDKITDLKEAITKETQSEKLSEEVMSKKKEVEQEVERLLKDIDNMVKENK